jgi:hypothetical protein
VVGAERGRTRTPRPPTMHLIWRIAKRSSFLQSVCTEVRTWPRSGASTKAAEHRRRPGPQAHISAAASSAGGRAEERMRCCCLHASAWPVMASRRACEPVGVPLRKKARGTWRGLPARLFHPLPVGKLHPSPVCSRHRTVCNSTHSKSPSFPACLCLCCQSTIYLLDLFLSLEYLAVAD